MICRSVRLLLVAIGAWGAGAASANNLPLPRKDAGWQKLVGDAKDDLANDRLADARDHAFDAQRIGDTPETSALLASALYGLGLVEDDKAEVAHATLMAEKCLQQLAEPDPDLEADRRVAIGISCLSVGARAYQQLGDNHHAHEFAERCIAPRAANAKLARVQLTCRRILAETEAVGYGVLGGTWWRYVVVTAQVGYGFRYFSAGTLSSPSIRGRLDGYVFEAAIGYPNFSIGSLLLRPELLVRSEQLGAETTKMGPVVNMMPTVVSTSSVAGVLSVGGRLVLTYPARLATIDVGLGVTASQLRALPNSTENNQFYLSSGNGLAQAVTSTDWSPEISILIRCGTPELRLGALAFVFAAFIEVSYALGWSVMPTNELTSVSVRGGVALRFRLGDLKSYY